jgi:uncharacterized protein (TIGR01777 family)
MKTIVIAGGSGFLGRSLSAFLSGRGYRVVILSRPISLRIDSQVPSNAQRGAIETVAWDAKTAGSWSETLEGAAALVNLVGKSVDCRYTPENRQEILESRLDSVRVLGAAISACRRPPEVFVQAASLAIYGDAGDRICTERTPPATGFSANVCLQWEAALRSLTLPATRTVTLRIGFALGRNGGALHTLATLAKWFIGGTAGTGDQYISWIHIDDLNEMFRWAIEKSALSGVFNATGPSPVTNREFMRALRSALHRPYAPPTPSWAVKIGAFILRTEPSLALTGRRSMPSRFLDHGFAFRFPELKTALSDLTG